jgi:hypothetical protein
MAEVTLVWYNKWEDKCFDTLNALANEIASYSWVDTVHIIPVPSEYIEKNKSYNPYFRLVGYSKRYRAINEGGEPIDMCHIVDGFMKKYHKVLEDEMDTQGY